MEYSDGMKRKLSGAFVAVLVIAWLSLFVSNKQVLVWELTPQESVAKCEKANAKLSKRREAGESGLLVSPFVCTDWQYWTCTYFNGRRLVDIGGGDSRDRRYAWVRKSHTGCPNIIDRGLGEGV